MSKANYGSPEKRKTYINEAGDEVIMPDSTVHIANEDASTSGPTMMGMIEFDDVTPKAINAKPQKSTKKKGAVKRVNEK